VIHAAMVSFTTCTTEVGVVSMEAQSLFFYVSGDEENGAMTVIAINYSHLHLHRTGWMI
jgi:hypothetical protein